MVARRRLKRPPRRSAHLAPHRARVSLAQAAGVSDNIPDLPAVFLGGFETTVRDLASAYTIFPNLGVYRPSFLISSIEDREGRVLWQAPRSEERVCIFQEGNVANASMNAIAPETAAMRRRLS